MAGLSNVSLALKALGELGPRAVGLYALYQVGLRSGWLRWATRSADVSGGSSQRAPLARWTYLVKRPSGSELADLLGDAGQQALMTEADEIVSGRVRLFGGEVVPLSLAATGQRVHWSRLKSQAGQTDIKLIWEPARFGWVFTLARAYRLSQEERYATAFWHYCESFLEANPPYSGPQWSSAQEAALRLMALVFAWQVLADAPASTPEKANWLAGVVAAHAARIPPTQLYARSQNNNHLLSEAAGLYTAGLALPNHPAARRWRSLGWRWFQRGLQAQIAEDGTYVQHSANYHRLMLQLSLWMKGLAQEDGSAFPEKSLQKLAAASRWLLALLDIESGRLPNLGPNDGAYILPLTGMPFSDYRPILQTATAAFLGKRLLPAGPWDEMSTWLLGEAVGDGGTPASQVDPGALVSECRAQPGAPPVLRSPDYTSWAALRVARYNSRPGHADQLHLDLWWRGLNLALDAGTYLYNADPPWDNALVSADVHNTLTVDGLDQMSRAGRFLYLDWAQAEVVGWERAVDGSWERLTARHMGYRRLGVIHERRVTVKKGGWLVEDWLLPIGRRPAGPRTASLHWLLPNWSYELHESQDCLSLRLTSPSGTVRLRLFPGGQAGETQKKPAWQLARGGELLAGEGPVLPTWGWFSPTYGVKIPALALRMNVTAPLPFSLRSVWEFPD